METIIIEVAKDKYASAKEARRDGQIPMICYNKEMDPEQFTTDYQNFRRAYKKAGKSAIITLQTDGKDVHKVLVQDVQYAPVSDDMIHIDLMAIRKGQKITTDIPLVFVGESAAVRELGGIFNTHKDKVHIECLPEDLVHDIEVDISPLVDFHTTLSVGDITVPDSITILDAEDISIAGVSQPRAAVEEEEAAEAAEGEEGAEGEAPAEGGEAAEAAEGEEESKEEA